LRGWAMLMGCRAKLLGVTRPGARLQPLVDKSFSDIAICPSSIRLHYDLARSYEDRGEAERAQEHYEFLLSWGFSYRDAYRRLENLRSGTEPRRSAYEQHFDYTGLT